MVHATKMANEDFEIPIEDSQSVDVSAALELEAFESGSLTPQQVHADWRLRFWLRTVFFFFALLINLWWDWNVRCMMWQSGREGTGFHLSDKVIIALLTSSIANFLALLTIIANHLFQKQPKKLSPQ